MNVLAAASLAILLLAVACLFFACWWGQTPVADVVTGAKVAGPAGKPAFLASEPYNALPSPLGNPKGPGARIAALDPQQARRDYEASVHAGLVESLADWDLRNAIRHADMTEADAAAGLLDTTVPPPRTED